jgi:hypothetical protein
MNTANLTFEQGVMVGAGGIAACLVILLILRPWRRTFFSGAPLSLAYIIGMRLRGNPPDFLIDAYLELVKGGLRIPMDHVECMYINKKFQITTPHDLAQLCLEQHNSQAKEDGQQDL